MLSVLQKIFLSFAWAVRRADLTRKPTTTTKENSMKIGYRHKTGQFEKL